MLNRYGLHLVEVKEHQDFKNAAHHPAELPEDGFHMYHATYLKHLPSISEHGLSPKKKAGGKFSAGNYASHSHGRVFVSRANRAANWMHKIGNVYDHEGEDHPDLSEVPHHEKDEAHEKWHDDHHDHTPVLIRHYGEQMHPKDEHKHPDHPHYRRDTEHEDDHYWENKDGHVHPDDIEVWHPHHKAWHPLDDDSIDEISQHTTKRLHKSLKEDPSGFSHDNNSHDRELHKSLDHEDSQ